MPGNILIARVQCPGCGQLHDVAMEFELGVLAGEEYVPGDRIAFQEEYSFFDQRVGTPGSHGEVEGEGHCDASNTPLVASILVENDVIVGLRVQTGDRR